MKKKITIGIASAYFALMKGGGEHYVLNLANHLADLGFKIEIICGRDPFIKPEPLSIKFKIYYIPQLYFLRVVGNKKIPLVSLVASFIHYSQYMLSCWLYLRFLAKKYDLLHAHEAASLWAATKVKEKLNIPVLATFHGLPAPWQLGHLKKVDAILAVSQEIEKIFSDAGFKNVYYSPPAVDLKIFRRMNKNLCRKKLKLDGEIVLFVGRLMPVKNIKALIKAFYYLKQENPKVRLIIVGEGPIKSRSRLLVNKLGLSQEVKFLGSIKNTELPYYYNAADVFVLPSLFESFAITALEALACRVPIFISKGARALIDTFGAEAMTIFDPHDPKKLAEKLAYLFQNKKRFRSKTKKGLKKIANYTWENRTRQIASIYQDILERDSEKNKTQELIKAFKTNKTYFEMMRAHNFPPGSKQPNVGDEVKELLLKNAKGRVLDAGCGEGSIAVWLAQQNRSTWIQGIDISPIGVKMGRNLVHHLGISNATFLVGDLLNLPFDNNYFDFIFAQSALEHVLNPRQCLQEFYRVLKMSGKLLIRVDNGASGFRFSWLDWLKGGDEPLPLCPTMILQPGNYGQHRANFDAFAIQSYVLLNLLKKIGFNVMFFTTFPKHVEEEIKNFPLAKKIAAQILIKIKQLSPFSLMGPTTIVLAKKRGQK